MGIRPLVHAFHDEVKPEKGRFPYLANGVLFVPDDYLVFLLEQMSAVRSREGYFNEVHYTDIKGTKGAAFKVAQGWTELFFSAAVRHCPFKTFIVDQSTDRRFPFPGDQDYPEHALHALCSTFVAGIAWSYGRSEKLEVRPVFDGSDNEVDKKLAASLPDALTSAVTERKLKGGQLHPSLKVSPVVSISSDPHKAEDSWAEAELIQLCDLLLGASVDAINFQERKPKTGRLKLASSVAEVLAETLEVPWLQRIPVHRRFSVSLYPDAFNLAYPAALRRVPREPESEQPKLSLSFV